MVINTGFFLTEEDAAEAYDQAVRKYRLGKYLLNFPDGHNRTVSPQKYGFRLNMPSHDVPSMTVWMVTVLLMLGKG